MDTEKKSTIIKVLITVLVVAALVATMTFALTGCSKNEPTQTDPTTQTNPSGSESTDPKPTDPQVTTYTVTFKDHDGTVLKTETIEEGKAATAPANPTREGYTFEGWDKTFDNVTADMEVTATYKAVETKPADPKPTDPQPTDPQVTTYTVTFKDYDGKVLKTETVEKGKAATPPANPTRENFAFNGWDKTFSSVTGDLVVTATYTMASKELTIYAESVTVNKGTNQVSVNIRVHNNPGIMGAILKVSVDDKVFAFEKGSKSGYPGLALTSPGSATKSSPYTFMLDAMELSDSDRVDGTLFTITFTIKDTTAVGNFPVALSYDHGAIFDESYADLKAVLENGMIVIQ